MIIGPLIGAGRVASEFDDAERQLPLLVNNQKWANYKTASWFILVTTLAFSISAGYRLWKIHVYESVRFAILTLWIAGPVGNLLYLTAALMIFGTSGMSPVLGKMLGGILAACVSAAIWTAYLMRSVRVRNTYAKKVST